MMLVTYLTATLTTGYPDSGLFRLTLRPLTAGLHPLIVGRAYFLAITLRRDFAQRFSFGLQNNAPRVVIPAYGICRVSFLLGRRKENQ